MTILRSAKTKNTKLRSTSLCCLAIGMLSGCHPMFYPHPNHPGMYGPNMQPQPLRSTMILPQDQIIGQPVAPGQVIESQPVGKPRPIETFQHDDSVKAPDPGSHDRGVDNRVPEPRDPGSTTEVQKPDVQTSEATNKGVSQLKPTDPVFLKPVVTTESGGESNTGIVSASAKGPLIGFEEDARFARQPQYQWLQGLLEYDPRAKSWHLIYDMSPKASDRLGGEVTLGGQLPFQMTDSNQFFRVYGGFDSARLDQLAKPTYQVSRIERIKAR